MLSDYDRKQLQNADGNFNDCLSSFEKMLYKLFYRTEIIGKKGKTLPVLFPSKGKVQMDLLIEKRHLIRNPNNSYLFPRKDSEFHIRGTDCLRKFSEECGAEAPERLRSTRLRKQIATMSQILNLQENELDILAQFLGHDICVHRDFYRLPSATIQVAKVSKWLLAMEKGLPGFHRGLSLNDITLDDKDAADGMCYMVVTCSQ